MAGPTPIGASTDNRSAAVERAGRDRLDCDRTVDTSPRSRPNDGAIWKLGTTAVATMGGPGILWDVALNATPHHGKGYNPLSLTSVWNGGEMWQ
jgi:hypothetical protein